MTELTFREKQFQKFWESGMSDELIAAQEGVSVNTVRCYRHAINKKLGKTTTRDTTKPAFPRKKGNPQAMPLAKQKKYDELVKERIAAKVAGNMALYEKVCKQMEAML